MTEKKNVKKKNRRRGIILPLISQGPGSYRGLPDTLAKLYGATDEQEKTPPPSKEAPKAPQAQG